MPVMIITHDMTEVTCMACDCLISASLSWYAFYHSAAQCYSEFYNADELRER